MKSMIVALAGIFSVVAGKAQPTEKLVDAYMDIKNALVADQAEAAVKAAQRFSTIAAATPALANQAALTAQAGKIAATTSMSTQRAAFQELSALFWQAVEKASPGKQTIYYQYCPMKKAGWLSLDKEIRNPYYGASMLTCGKVTAQH